MKPRQQDILSRLLDPEEIRLSCDLAGNPAYRTAEWRSRGHDGLRLVDLFQNTTLDERTEWLTRLLSLSPKEVQQELGPIRIRVINCPGSKNPRYPTATPEELETLQGKEREIAVPGPAQRILFEHLGRVLKDCLDPLLPREAVAYRPGRQDSVRVTQREAAQQVLLGANYYLSLDIRSFFPSMPHGETCEALDGMGVPRQAVELVRSILTLPLAGERGPWTTPTRGCPAGIAIADVLANVLLAGLDRAVMGRYGSRLSLYRRYSDDLVVMGHCREQLVGVFREVRDWLAAHGLSLKGLGPNASPRYQVKNITKTPMELLGVRITGDGFIAPIAERLAAKRAQVQYRMARLVTHDTVVGTSALQGGGVDLYSLGDCQRIVQGTRAYMAPQVGATDKLRAALMADPKSGLEEAPKGVNPQWACVIEPLAQDRRANPHAVQGGASASLAVRPCENSNKEGVPVRDGVPQGPDLRGPRATGDRVRVVSPLPPGDSEGTSLRESSYGCLASPSGPREGLQALAGVHGGDGASSLSPLDLYRSSGRVLGLGGRDGVSPSPAQWDHSARRGEGSGAGDVVPSLSGETFSSSSSCCCCSLDDESHSSLSQTPGHVPGQRQTSPVVAPHRERSEIQTAWSWGRDREWRLAWAEGGQAHLVPLPPRMPERTGGRRSSRSGRDTALVRLISWLVQRAQAHGVQHLTVQLQAEQLPKALMQRTHRFASVALVRELLELHELIARGTCTVVLVGPCDVPVSLRTLLTHATLRGAA